jgi:hypothetical protein
MGKDCGISDLEDDKAYLAVKPGTTCDWFHKFTMTCVYNEPEKLINNNVPSTVYIGSIGLDWGKISSIALGSCFAFVLILWIFMKLRTNNAVVLR